MRGRDPLDPCAWRAEAEDLAGSYDLSEEVGLALGSRGAPDVETIVEEFKGLRDRALPELAAAVREVSSAVTARLGAQVAATSREASASRGRGGR